MSFSKLCSYSHLQVFFHLKADNYSFHLDGKLIELGPEEVFLPK